MGCGASQPASENAEHPRPREKPRGEDIDASSSSKASSSKGKGSGRRLPISEGGEARDVIVLFGPPGAGKGSQAPHIVAKLNIPHISVGGIMRDAIEERTPLGLVCREVMEADGLITDDVVAGLIRERIARKDCDRGFVMDGFPRTVEQAQGETRPGNLRRLDLILRERRGGRRRDVPARRGRARAGVCRLGRRAHRRWRARRGSGDLAHRAEIGRDRDPRACAATAPDGPDASRAARFVRRGVL